MTKLPRVTLPRMTLYQSRRPGDYAHTDRHCPEFSTLLSRSLRRQIISDDLINQVDTCPACSGTIVDVVQDLGEVNHAAAYYESILGQERTPSGTLDRLAHLQLATRGTWSTHLPGVPRPSRAVKSDEGRAAWERVAVALEPHYQEVLQEVTDPQWEKALLSGAYSSTSQDEYLVVLVGYEHSLLSDHTSPGWPDFVMRRKQTYHYLTGNLETPLGNATWVRATQGVAALLVGATQAELVAGPRECLRDDMRSVRLDGDETDVVLETASGLYDPRGTGHLSTLEGALQAARLLHEL